MHINLGAEIDMKWTVSITDDHTPKSTVFATGT